MNIVTRNRISMVILLVSLSGCSTPSAVRKGAELSAEQLTVLQSSLQAYVQLSNQDITLRNQRLKQRLVEQQRLHKTRDVALYVGLANDWAMTHSFVGMSALAARFDKRDADAEAARRLLSQRLAGMTRKLAISKESFATTQQALAKLADEDSFAEQFGFFVLYVDDVQKGVQAHVAAERKKQAEAAVKAKAEEEAEKAKKAATAGGSVAGS